MPVTVCSSRDLERVVAELEAKGNRLQSVAAANEDSFVIAYYKGRPATGKETR